MNDSKIVISKSELFRHPQFGNLRVLTDEKGDPWFVGKVVAEALGYKIPQKAISDHVLSSDRKVLKYKAFSEMEKAKIWQGNDFSDKSLINESGVYSLILGSQLPSAIEFKHWVTSEVLPQIRKTGGYEQKNEVEKQLRSDLEIMSLAYGIHDSKIAERDQKIEELKEKIRELEQPTTPKGHIDVRIEITFK